LQNDTGTFSLGQQQSLAPYVLEDAKLRGKQTRAHMLTQIATALSDQDVTTSRNWMSAFGLGDMSNTMFGTPLPQATVNAAGKIGVPVDKNGRLDYTGVQKTVDRQLDNDDMLNLHELNTTAPDSFAQLPPDYQKQYAAFIEKEKLAEQSWQQSERMFRANQGTPLAQLYPTDAPPATFDYPLFGKPKPTVQQEMELVRNSLEQMAREREKQRTMRYYKPWLQDQFPPMDRRGIYSPAYDRNPVTPMNPIVKSLFQL
jgi:hypothetical protein